jgi:N-acetylglucosaminyl-diphospho-decaprenol L-rhamnosyltransferase
MSTNHIYFSIIIVNYNTKKLLGECLDSIYNSEFDQRFEVIIIDNNSSDGSINFIKKNYPFSKLIINDENYGFAKACNQGIKKSKGKYILLINSDSELFPDTLKNLKEYLSFGRENPKISIIGGKILNTDGSLQFSMGKFPTILSTFFDMFKPYNKRKVFTWGYDKICEVDWVTGAFMLIDKQLFSSLGLFDETYFMYYEETDFCLKAKKNGWKVYYYPHASIIHKMPTAQKKDKMNSRLLVEMRKSHLYYFRKNHNYISFFSIVIATFFIFCIKYLKIKLLYMKNRGAYTEQLIKIKDLISYTWENFLKIK